MANEITLNLNITFTKNGVTVERDLVDKLATLSGNRYVAAIQSVGTSEEAIDLAELGTLGWAYFKNLDANNYIQLKTATSGTIFARLNAGEACLFRFGSGVTAPFAISDTAACLMEYLILEQ